VSHNCTNRTCPDDSISYNRLVTITLQQETLLKRYAEAVVNAPPHLHLTSGRDMKQFWTRHVLDGMQLFEFVPPSARKKGVRVLDVGSGNGIPGIPLAILEPEWSVELLDSDTKKCGFLDVFCKNYAIKNARVIVGRAELLAQGAMRECYDIVFSRAVGKLPVALELAGPFVKVGGLLIVPHGTTWEAELKEGQKAVDALGLKFLRSEEYRLDDVSFNAIMLEKVSQTPKSYPRSVGIPQKRPLM
jgi:16S rRNA (guanine527-N7)-methyltransferase